MQEIYMTAKLSACSRRFIFQYRHRVWHPHSSQSIILSGGEERLNRYTFPRCIHATTYSWSCDTSHDILARASGVVFGKTSIGGTAAFELESTYDCIGYTVPTAYSRDSGRLCGYSSCFCVCLNNIVQY